MKTALKKERDERKSADACTRDLIAANQALLAHSKGLDNDVQALQADGAHKDAKMRHLAMQVCTILTSSSTHFA